MPRQSQEAAVQAREEEVPTPVATGNRPYEEAYWEVVFAEKTNENETTDVPLCVNGEVLVIQRGKPVIIPQRYLECADHTKHEIISQDPGKDRKTVAWVQTYAYTKIRQASKDEFTRFKQAGDKATLDRIERMQAAQP